MAPVSIHFHYLTRLRSAITPTIIRKSFTKMPFRRVMPSDQIPIYRRLILETHLNDEFGIVNPRNSNLINKFGILWPLETVLNFWE